LSARFNASVATPLAIDKSSLLTLALENSRDRNTRGLYALPSLTANATNGQKAPPA
jgi:hypothetical protein